MLEAIPAEIDFVFRDRIKHERVVRIGRMSEGEDFRRAPHGRMLSASRKQANRAFFIVICVLSALPIASDTWRRWRRPVSAKAWARSSEPVHRLFETMSILAKRSIRSDLPQLFRVHCSHERISRRKRCRNWSIQFGNTESFNR